MRLLGLLRWVRVLSFCIHGWRGTVENTYAQLSSLPANTEAAAGALLSADLINSIHMCAPHGWMGLLMPTGNFRPFLLPCHGLYAQQLAVSLHTKTGLVWTGEDKCRSAEMSFISFVMESTLKGWMCGKTRMSYLYNVSGFFFLF